jgi:hypothetical protein
MVVKREARGVGPVWTQAKARRARLVAPTARPAGVDPLIRHAEPHGRAVGGPELRGIRDCVAREGGRRRWQYLEGMASSRPSPVYGRVVERRRAVALARQFREAEGLSIAQIANRLGRSPATIKAYFYGPTGDKARAVKARYVGVCRGCGAYTQPRNGKGDAYAYCKVCHPGAIERRWTPERVIAAICAWRARYEKFPSSYDWSRAHARRRGGAALERLREGEWPAASVVSDLFGTWAAARAAASRHEVRASTRQG